MIKKLAPRSRDSVVDDVVKYLNIYMKQYGVDTPLRVAHFMAQAAHESDSFKTLMEYWGPTAAQRRYEGRKDLGNVQPGDGKRFMGRGIFQLTGRANYRQMSKILGVNLESNPDMAATGEISVRTALEYWRTRNLNALADRDDVRAVTKRINGGYNGLQDRINYLAKAKEIFKDVKFEDSAKPDETPDTPKASPLNIVMADKGDESMYVRDLQLLLKSRGYDVEPNGIFDDATEDKVKEFQSKNGLEATGKIDTDTLNKLLVMPEITSAFM